ncbi:MAG: Iron-regulated protein precursor [Labilithrix sp.]|nr:Iron-regulated protein precursor [Labilithrix sp.]
MLRTTLCSTLTACVLFLGVGACSDDDTNDTNTGTSKDPLAEAQPVVDQYAKNVHANYTEVLEKARALKTAVDAFVASPSAETQQAAKTAWIAARLPYGPSEVFRFYGGPIDDEATGPEGAINAWPLDENHIDYTRDDENAGTINHADLVPEITKDAIRGENEKGGEKNISTGYHAIEFLLWGQDSDDASTKTAGQRPHTDYLTTGGTAKNQDRRGTYLKLVAEILVEDLESVTTAWEPGKDNYGKTFASNVKEAVTKMLTGMGSMANAELSGERMTVAYKNKGQEDEHSCFSDTTNADLLGNFVGIQNVYLGKYGSADGPGLDVLVKAVDPALDAQMQKELSDAVTALNAMQSVPFDYAIMAADGSPERANVLKAIQAIKATAPTIVKIGEKLGVEFQLEQPSEEL